MSRLTPEQWQQVSPYLDEALELYPEQRAEWLLSLSEKDAQLASMVQALLDEQQQAEREGFLEKSPLQTGRGLAGQKVGPYTLVSQIGQGGMGSVWLAQRSDGRFERKAAVKFVNIALSGRAAEERFKREGSILGRLIHPHIAELLDAGICSDGTPYLILEYVEGEAIDQYCDDHKLAVDSRIKVFLDVLSAVAEAHTNLIVHRDIKPSNVLVRKDGQVKLLDFGIAKLLAHDDSAAATMLTMEAGGALTPRFAAPEQMTGGTVTTATDVYALGVMLYVLLTGQHPAGTNVHSPAELFKAIVEQEAPRASAVALAAGSAAENRCSSLEKLSRQLRGDLDTILSKALKKNPHERYTSVAALADDLRRYLKHETISARPDTFAYRARKYVRRHRIGVGALAVVVLVLIVAAAISIRQSIRANREAAVAQAVDDFLQNDVLAQASAASQSESATKPNPHLEVRTALDRAAARIGGKFGGQPEVEAAIRRTMGRAYSDLGLHPEARTQFQRALDLYREVLGAKNPNTLKTMSLLGRVAYDLGKYSEAETLLTQTLNVQQHVLGPQDPDTLNSMNSLARVYDDQGKYAHAEALFAQTLATERRVLGPEHPDVLKSMNNLAIVYDEEGKYVRAEALFEQTLVIGRRVRGPEHPDTLASMGNLAIVYQDEGKHAQAEALLEQTLMIKRRVLGPEHPETLKSMSNLAGVYEDEGKYAQAEPLFEQTLVIGRRVRGPEHPDTLLSMGNLAIVYQDEGKYAQAEALFEQTLRAERRVLGPGHPWTLLSLSYLASMYQKQGKYGLAESYAAQALAGQRHALGSEHPDTMTSAGDLALTLVSQRKFAESEPLAREGFQFFRKGNPDSWQTFRAESLLGASLAGQRKYAEAEPLLLEGYQGMLARKDRIPVPNWYHLDRAHDWLVQLYKAWGKPAQAAEWSKK